MCPYDINVPKHIICTGVISIISEEMCFHCLSSVNQTEGYFLLYQEIKTFKGAIMKFN